MKGTLNLNLKIGNLGADPEIRHSSGGTCVTRISIATTFTRGQGDARTEETEWHDVKFIGKLAEIAGAILFKGCKVYIEGRDQTDSWPHKHYKDVTVRKHWIIANKLELLSPFRTDEDASTAAKYGHGTAAPGVIERAANAQTEDSDGDVLF